jgi:hypothetical protein
MPALFHFEKEKKQPALIILLKGKRRGLQKKGK